MFLLVFASYDHYAFNLASRDLVYQSLNLASVPTSFSDLGDQNLVLRNNVYKSDQLINIIIDSAGISSFVGYLTVQSNQVYPDFTAVLSSQLKCFFIFNNQLVYPAEISFTVQNPAKLYNTDFSGFSAQVSYQYEFTDDFVFTNHVATQKILSQNLLFATLKATNGVQIASALQTYQFYSGKLNRSTSTESELTSVLKNNQFQFTTQMLVQTSLNLDINQFSLQITNPLSVSRKMVLVTSKSAFPFNQHFYFLVNGQKVFGQLLDQQNLLFQFDASVQNGVYVFYCVIQKFTVQQFSFNLVLEFQSLYQMQQILIDIQDKFANEIDQKLMKFIFNVESGSAVVSIGEIEIYSQVAQQQIEVFQLFGQVATNQIIQVQTESGVKKYRITQRIKGEALTDNGYEFTSLQLMTNGEIAASVVAGVLVILVLMMVWYQWWIHSHILEVPGVLLD